MGFFIIIIIVFSATWLGRAIALLPPQQVVLISCKSIFNNKQTFLQWLKLRNRHEVCSGIWDRQERMANIYPRETDKCGRYCRNVFTTDHWPLKFSAESFKRNSFPKEEIWLLRLSLLLWGQKPGTLPVLTVPPRDILQNISNSNGFHYLMISNIMHRNEN